jgi:hypothetical protein
MSNFFGGDDSVVLRCEEVVTTLKEGEDEEKDNN